MILSDVGIAEAVNGGRLDISPFSNDLLQPASYDLRLDRHFRRFLPPGTGAHRLVDPADPVDTTQAFQVDGERVGLEPHCFVLASTVEKIRMPNDLVARVEGKSSLARLGLFVHVTAGFIDPGFNGHITLELFCGNGRGIWLYPGMPVAQIAFETMSAPAQVAYQGKYQHSTQPGPVPSKYYLNFPLEGTR